MRFVSCLIISVIVRIVSCTEWYSAPVSPQAFLHQTSSARTSTRAAVSQHGQLQVTQATRLLGVAHDRTSPSAPKSSSTRWWFAQARRLRPSRSSRPRAADRRLFFSFNQMLLSLIAPRLMRYQFDLMMHSVVAELFRKVLAPAVGSFSGESNSIFSSLSNLLRSRQTAPRTTTAAPTVDVQRLLDNANKLIALQSLMRTKQNSPTPTSSNPILSAQPQSINGSLNQEPHKHRDHSATVTDTQIDRQNSSQSPNANNEQPIHLAISTKDFMNFLQNNLKQSQANFNSTAKNTAFQLETGSNFNQQMHGTSFGHSHSESGIDAAKEIGFNGLQEGGARKSGPMPNHRTRMEDFKMSHLTFIDTEVPNYGNQLLVRDQDELNGLRHGEPSQADQVDSSKSQLGLIDSSLLNEKEFNSFKSDDLERANRWNDVLVNMNGISQSTNG